MASADATAIVDEMRRLAQRVQIMAAALLEKTKLVSELRAEIAELKRINRQDNIDHLCDIASLQAVRL